MVRVDLNKFAHVIRSLVLNALKYTPSGRNISVTANVVHTHDENPEILTAQEHQSYALGADKPMLHIEIVGCMMLGGEV